MFTFYNPHPQGKDVTDCVKRALTKATGKEYREVSNELNRIKRELGKKKFNDNVVWTEYLKRMHAEKISFPAVKGQPRMNGERFCEAYPVGTYVLRMAGHLSCAVDGIIYDSWDCTDKCVYNAYKINLKEEVSMVEFNEDAVELGACGDCRNDSENKNPQVTIHYSGKDIIEKIAKEIKAEVQITKKGEPWFYYTDEQYSSVLQMLNSKEFMHLNWKTPRGSRRSKIWDQRTGMTLILNNNEGKKYLWCTNN